MGCPLYRVCMHLRESIIEVMLVQVPHIFEPSCGYSFFSITAQPIHWVYNEDVLAKAVEGVDPEFLPKSVNPFYTLPTGQQSPYGDQLIVMLESIVACKGECVKLKQFFV